MPKFSSLFMLICLLYIRKVIIDIVSLEIKIWQILSKVIFIKNGVAKLSILNEFGWKRYQIIHCKTTRLVCWWSFHLSNMGIWAVRSHAETRNICLKLWALGNSYKSLLSLKKFWESDRHFLKSTTII